MIKHNENIKLPNLSKYMSDEDLVRFREIIAKKIATNIVHDAIESVLKNGK